MVEQVFLRSADPEHWSQLSDFCVRYDPCPICYKCRQKASHLFLRCQDCGVPRCIHTEAERALMIKRENFAINMDNPAKRTWALPSD